MKRKRFFKVLILGCVFVLCSSCVSNKNSKDDFLYIMIYDYDNNGVQGVTLTLDDEKIIGQTDLYGRYSLHLDDKNEHKLVFTKEGYQTITKKVIFASSDILYIKIGDSLQFLSMAETEMDKNDYELALEYINLSIKLDPKRIDAIYLKCLILYKLGQYQECSDLIKSTEDSTNFSYFAVLKEKLNIGE